MTPQEQEMIEKLADKLAAKQDITQDPAAAELISSKIASQRDIIYRLSQLALAQEVALTELKKRNDYLQNNADFYKQESQRGTMSRMFGENRQPPTPPASSYQPSAFGGFMQTAAGVAAGMVAGNALSHLFFSDSHAAEQPIVQDVTNNYYQQPDDTNNAQADDSQPSDNTAADASQPDDSASSFLAGTDDYTQSYTGGGWNTDTGFGNPDDLSFDDPSNNGFDDDSSRWGGNDDSSSDFGSDAFSDDSGDWGDDDSSW